MTPTTRCAFLSDVGRGMLAAGRGVPADKGRSRPLVSCRTQGRSGVSAD